MWTASRAPPVAQQIDDVHEGMVCTSFRAVGILIAAFGLLPQTGLVDTGQEAADPQRDDQDEDGPTGAGDRAVALRPAGGPLEPAKPARASLSMTLRRNAPPSGWPAAPSPNLRRVRTSDPPAGRVDVAVG
jgi:hypothetical protein